MYATPKATIDGTKLPTVSCVGKDFYGWKHSNSEYAYFANVTGDNSYYLKPSVNTGCELKAMYKEQKPSYKLDLTNKKVTNLLPNRTYAYPKYDYNEAYYTNTVKSDEIPILNEEECLEEMYRRLLEVLKTLGKTYEVIFVNDGSTDGSLEILKNIQANDETIKIINLSRNFGHQAAITAGMNCAEGDATYYH